MIEENESNQQIENNPYTLYVQKTDSMPFIPAESESKELPEESVTALGLVSESKLSEHEVEKYNQQKLRQFNRQTTLEDIENPFLTMDERIRNAMIALKRPIHQRNLKEQKAIIRVIESNHFIQKTKQYNKNLLNLVANCVTLEKIQKGKAVFEYGDRPDKFYLIVSGKVSVLVPKSKNEISQIKEDIENESCSASSIDSPLKKKTNDLRHQTLLLNFPNMGISTQKQRKHDNSSDQNSLQTSLDNSKFVDELNSPLTLQIRKKSNFSQVNSERQIKINQNISKITNGSHFQPANLLKKSQQYKKKKVDDCLYQEDEQIIPGIPLIRSEIFNWRSYFLVEDDISIMKYNHIKFLSEGEVFGDFGLLVRKPRSATILAVQDTILLSVQKQDYEDLIREISYVIILQF